MKNTTGSPTREDDWKQRSSDRNLRELLLNAETDEAGFRCAATSQSTETLTKQETTICAQNKSIIPQMLHYCWNLELFKPRLTPRIISTDNFLIIHPALGLNLSTDSSQGLLK